MPRKKKNSKKASEKKAKTVPDSKEKGEKPAPPADVKFRLLKDDKSTESTSSLRLKQGESLPEGIERLAADGWNIKDQPYVRQGNILKALAKRVKGATRSLEVDKPVKVEYYDIIEADSQDAIVDKLFDQEIIYKGTKSGMLVGETKAGKYIGFPVNIVANTIPLEAESEAADPPENPEENE